MEQKLKYFSVNNSYYFVQYLLHV